MPVGQTWQLARAWLQSADGWGPRTRGQGTGELETMRHNAPSVLPLMAFTTGTSGSALVCGKDAELSPQR